MAYDHPRVRAADRPRRLDIDVFFDAQGIGAHDARGARNDGDGDGQHHIGKGTAQDGDDGQRQNQQREGQHHIYEALQEQVHFAAQIGAGHAQDGPTGRADKGGGQADEQRNARAVDDAGEQIPAELVGAEPVFQARGVELQALIDFIGIIGGDGTGKDGGDDH